MAVAVRRPASEGGQTLWEDLEAEAAAHAAGDRYRLATPEMLAQIRKLQVLQAQSSRELSLFKSTDDVIIVPGLLGSALEDTSGRFGLIRSTRRSSSMRAS